MTKNVELYDLSSHPEYARTAGRIFAVWTKIEFRLCNLFTILLRSPPWVGQSAYYAIVNNRARLDMLRALAQRLDQSNQDRKTILDIVDKVSNAPAARHGYAHKPWLLYKRKIYQMDEVAPNLNLAKKHHVSLAQMRQDLKDLNDLDKLIEKFIQDYSERNPTTISVTKDDLAWIEKLPRHIPDPTP